MFNNSNQFKQYIRKLAKSLNIGIEYAYQNYLLEEFADKISKSEYKNEFVFKGGFVLSNIIGLDTRTTRDIDLTSKTKSYTLEQINEIVNEICMINTSSIFAYKVDHIVSEMSGKDERGYKIIIKAKFDDLVFSLKVDLSCGGFIYPRDIDYKMNGKMLGKEISVLTYPIENIIAEKYETLIDRGQENGRMRDYFDLYVLLKNQDKYSVNMKNLIVTLYKVSASRSTIETLAYGDEILNEIEKSIDFKQYWKNYITRINTEASKIETSELFVLLHNVQSNYMNYICSLGD